MAPEPITPIVEDLSIEKITAETAEFSRRSTELKFIYDPFEAIR
jgi:hypothetical protein